MSLLSSSVFQCISHTGSQALYYNSSMWMSNKCDTYIHITNFCMWIIQQKPIQKGERTLEKLQSTVLPTITEVSHIFHCSLIMKVTTKQPNKINCIQWVPWDLGGLQFLSCQCPVTNPLQLFLLRPGFSFWWASREVGTELLGMSSPSQLSLLCSTKILFLLCSYLCVPIVSTYLQF